MKKNVVVPDIALDGVAAYFAVLAEPKRLKLLQVLQSGERSVGELAELAECSIANVSRHLSLMARHGMVSRTSEGTTVYYAIADETIYALCDLVCNGLVKRMDAQSVAHKALRKMVG